MKVHAVMRELLQDIQQCIHPVNALAQDTRTGRGKKIVVLLLSHACCTLRIAKACVVPTERILTVKLRSEIGNHYRFTGYQPYLLA